MDAPDLTSMDAAPIVLMADAPVDGYDAAAPFAGPVGTRIAQIVDLPFDRLGDAFELQYVFDRRPIGDAKIPMGVARHVCNLLAPKLRNRHVLFYGRALSMAFGFTPSRPMQWHGARYQPGADPLFAFAVVPDFDPRADPGWSQWWARAECVHEAADFLRPLVHPRARD